MHPKIIQALKDVKAGKEKRIDIESLKTSVYRVGKLIRVDFKDQFE